MEALKKFADVGMTYRDIAIMLNVDTSTVCKWCKKEGIVLNKEARKAKVVKDESSKEPGIGSNADRHLCKTCMFRCENTKGISCDYICYTGYTRGCAAKDCTVYQKGNPEDARRIYKKQ